MKNIELRQGNITEFEGDAIVNSANSGLTAEGAVSRAVFDAAGYDEMTHACQEIGTCNYGDAVVTPGFKLLAHYVIHAVGPTVGRHNGSEPDILRSCYARSLQIAHTNCFESVAFPLISTANNGLPKEEAVRIALDAIREFYQDSPHTCVTRVVLYGFTDEDTEVMCGELDEK